MKTTTPDQGSEIESFAKQRREQGITCEEVEKRFGYRHQAASAKISRMKTAGILLPTGRQRLNSSGRKAEVLVHYWFAPVKVF